jgi:hypothetical protein
LRELGPQEEDCPDLVNDPAPDQAAPASDGGDQARPGETR